MTVWGWGLLSLWLAGAASGAPAPSPLLRSASNDYAEGRFPSAIRRVDEVLRGPALQDVTAARALLLRAKCLAALRRYPEVEDTLTQALTHDPEATLDADADPPALVSLLESLKKRLRGTVRLNVEPAGSVASMDGEPLSEQPPTGGKSLDPLRQESIFRREVAIGRHHLEVRHDVSAKAVSREVVVRPGRDVEISVVLPREPVAAEASAQSPAATALVPARRHKGLPELLHASLRASRDLAGGFSFAAGAGVDLHHVYATGSYVLAAVPAAELQLGAELRRAFGVMGGFLGVEGTYFFGKAHLAGYGATGGLLVQATDWLEPFASFTWARLPSPGAYRRDYALVSAGVRLRLPAD